MKKTMKKSRKKLIACLAAAAVLVGIFSTWITGTLASKPDYTQDFTANPNQGYTVLEKGQQWGPTYISGMIFATPSDPTIATSTASSNKLTVTGLKAGVFKVTYSNKKGQMASAAFQIKDSANLQRYSITNNAQGVIQNVGGTLSVPITTVPSTLGVPIKWSSMDTSVATVDINTGLITAKGEGATVILGETVDMWGVTRIISYSINVGKSGNANVIQDSGTGKYYIPTEHPYIFIECDKNGIPKVPVNYVYDGDKNPANGVTGPAAYPHGKDFYVEDPAGSNIYKKVDPNNGGKIPSPAMWGGTTPGLGNDPDEQPAKLFGGTYYIDKGQNVYQKVNGPTTLGPLVGAGTDSDPSTYPVTPIYNNNGKYYVGPLGTNPEQYYYGDKAGSTDGIQSSTTTMAPTDDKYYLSSDGTMNAWPPNLLKNTSFNFDSGSNTYSNWVFVSFSQTGGASPHNGKIMTTLTPDTSGWYKVAPDTYNSLVKSGVDGSIILCYQDRNGGQDLIDMLQLINTVPGKQYKITVPMQNIVRQGSPRANIWAADVIGDPILIENTLPGTGLSWRSFTGDATLVATFTAKSYQTWIGIGLDDNCTNSTGQYSQVRIVNPSVVPLN